MFNFAFDLKMGAKVMLFCFVSDFMKNELLMAIFALVQQNLGDESFNRNV